LNELRYKRTSKILRAIIEHSPIGISVRDAKGTLLIVNKAWMKIWGKTKEEVRNERDYNKKELKMDERDSYLGKHLEAVQRVYIEGGKYFIPELKIPNPPSGAAEWISHNLYAIKDSDGKVEKVVVLTQDLTERIKVRENLSETKEYYQTMIKDLPIGIFRTSLDEEGKMLSANHEMLKMFGVSSLGDINEITVRGLYVDIQRRQKLLDTIKEKKEIMNFEAELKKQDGLPFVALITARESVDPETGKGCLEGIVQDITAKRKTEKEIQRIENLESLGILAGGIAHDFNNILTGIQGSISIVLEQTGDKRILDNLYRAERSASEAAQLTKQLLTFSRGGTPVKKIIGIKALIIDTADFILSGSSVSIKYDIPDEIMNINADRGQIAQVIQNLIINAKQAMPDGGKINIKAENVLLNIGEMKGLKQGEYVRITVNDTGSGVPQGDISRIFDPYFTTKEEGSGLGLATSHSIITRHSGTITVSNHPEGGAEFIVTLPASSETERKTEEKEMKISRGSGRVLIMDDDVVVRDVLNVMLEQTGYQSVQSCDGEEAIILYKDALEAGRPFDCVVMDLTIPGGMGGVEAIQHLKKIDPNVIAIVASGYSNDDALSNYEDYGFSGRLEKPFRLKTLAETVRTVISARQKKEGK